MSSTKEQLLQPRYKVIADYPLSSFKIGDIITDPVRPYWEIDGKESNPEDYPTIFYSLPWWADRDEKDMPEYVMNDDSLNITEEFVRVIEWDVEDTDDGCPSFKDRDNFWTHVRGFLPATESEYQSFKTKTTE